jgi:transcriptional regulator with XRE-family HTH domain
MGRGESRRSRGEWRGRRALLEFGSEALDARLRGAISQEELGRQLDMSARKVARIERGTLLTLSIKDASEMAAVLGLDLSVRVYPAGPPIRDAGQAVKLNGLLQYVNEPLTYRTDVPLPQHPDRPTELRAWDAVLYGSGERTGIELEARLRDAQATTRRHALKRRDDPMEHFLLVLSDTRNNRRLLDEFAELFVDLPRLRTTSVLKSLAAGRHPQTGLILI